LGATMLSAKQLKSRSTLALAHSRMDEYPWRAPALHSLRGSPTDVFTANPRDKSAIYRTDGCVLILERAHPPRNHVGI
jgi:hypothetical protein